MKNCILSVVEVAILGIIAEQCCKGHEIDSVIESKRMRTFLKVGPSSIYAFLKHLESGGLISSQTSQSDRAISMRLYSITDLGKQTLLEETKNILCDTLLFHSELDIALANLHHLDKMEAIVGLKAYEKHLDQSIEQLESTLHLFKSEGGAYNILAVFQRNLIHLYAEKKWLFNLIQQVWNSHESSDPVSSFPPIEHHEIDTHRNSKGVVITS